MTGLQLAALTGLMLATSVLCAVWWLAPTAPALGPALDRLTGLPTPPALLGGRVDAQDRVGAWVARWVPKWVLMTPAKELALLRRTEASFYGEKLILAAIGLVAPPLLSTLFSVFGLRFPIAVPLIASLLGAVGLFVLPNVDIHGKAKAARLEFNHVLTGFIDLVALERRAGSGPRQALENAARVGRGQWVFDRLAEGFTQSSVDGRPPWDVLRAMGDELALPELDDLANIMALAEQQTMPVYQTLREHNRALRVALLTDEQARANAASERLTIPATMLAIVFIAILLGPSLMTLKEPDGARAWAEGRRGPGRPDARAGVRGRPVRVADRQVGADERRRVRSGGPGGVRRQGPDLGHHRQLRPRDLGRPGERPHAAHRARVLARLEGDTGHPVVRPRDPDRVHLGGVPVPPRRRAAGEDVRQRLRQRTPHRPGRARQARGPLGVPRGAVDRRVLRAARLPDGAVRPACRAQARVGAADMALHGVRRGRLVPGGQRREDLAVLLDETRPEGRPGGHLVGRLGDRSEERLADGHREVRDQLVGPHLGDHDVEAGVERVERVHGVRVVHRREDRPDALEFGRGRVPGRQRDRTALQQDPRLDDLVDLVLAEDDVQLEQAAERGGLAAGDAGPGRGTSPDGGVQDTLGLEGPDRLTDRRPADAQLGREIALGGKGGTDGEPTRQEAFLDVGQHHFERPHRTPLPGPRRPGRRDKKRSRIDHDGRWACQNRPHGPTIGGEWSDQNDESGPGYARVHMFQPEIAPLGSLWLSALVALLPLLTVFVLLGWLRWKAHLAGLAALLVATLVAVLAFKMPAGLALLSATEGAAFGLFPITWIVLTAVWLYELTVVSGRFEDLRGTFHLISDDPRILAVLIAFCFGGLLEALAGFGAPVAITGVMLIAVGFPPLRAATTVLLANTAPVAFGAIAIPIITAGNLTGIPYREIGAYVGHQTPLMAWAVPILLVLVADGFRGVKETWPVLLSVGLTFAVAQWVSATWISVELTDVIASLAALGAGVLALRVWRPRNTHEAELRLAGVREAESAAGFTSTLDLSAHEEVVRKPNGRQIAMALFPYLLVIAVFSIAKLVPPVVAWLASTDVKIPWPGLHGNVLKASGEINGSTMYNFSWLSNPGTLLLLSGIVVAIVYRVSARQAAATFGAMVYKLRWSMLTIASVLALAYVMNLSGQTITIGTWIASVGAVFAFLSPTLGWIGTAVTGSDTSANALFATLQQTAGQNAGIDPTLLVAANTSGGVVGKMISPQNLAIAATAVGLVGKESDIFRTAIRWSLGLLLVLCLLVGLQSTPVLSWMLP